MEKRFVNSMTAKSNRLILPFLLGAAIFLCLPLQGAAQTGATTNAQTNRIATENWTGGYFFDDSPATARRRRTDVAPQANYDVFVEERAGGQLVASFTAQGTQLFDAYECSVKWTDERADFYFEKNADPNFPNVKKFKRGDFLFSLVKVEVGKETKYRIEPNGYRIVRANPANQKSNVYFVKQ